VADELVTGAAYDADLQVRSEAERLVDLRIVPWGVVGATAEGPELLRRGAFRGTRPQDVSLEAIGPHGNAPGVRLAGRAIALEERDDGGYGTFRVSRTRDGDELLELARDGTYRAASAVFEPIPEATRVVNGVIERSRVRLVRVGIVERGAYPGAEVLAVRSATGGTMPAIDPVPDPTPEPVPDPEPTPVPPGTRAYRVATSEPELLARMAELRTDLVGRMALLEAGGAARSSASPLAAYPSLLAYADAAYVDPSLAPLLGRALADQLTTDNPGVIPPSWAQNVAGILARPRPAIQALGGPRPLGDSGMSLSWPYLDPALDLDTVVAKQLAEKTEIASVKVKLLKGDSAIETFAGGSDLSYQLIKRSSPSYREAYLRILAIAYARATEAEFEADLEAGAGSTAVLPPTANAAAVRAFLFAASSTVEDATGSPATVDLVSSAEFARLGGLPDLMPPQYGTSNQSGVASAASLRIEISGLPIIRAPFLTGNTHIVTNGEAAAWHEDGPFPISAEDVAKLGQNVAIWGMGTTAITVPTGIVKSTAVAGRAARGE
jgi:HK97 family phage prohead protease